MGQPHLSECPQRGISGRGRGLHLLPARPQSRRNTAQRPPQNRGSQAGCLQPTPFQRAPCIRGGKSPPPCPCAQCPGPRRGRAVRGGIPWCWLPAGAAWHLDAVPGCHGAGTPLFLAIWPPPASRASKTPPKQCELCCCRPQNAGKLRYGRKQRGSRWDCCGAWCWHGGTGLLPPRSLRWASPARQPGLAPHAESPCSKHRIHSTTTAARLSL